MTEVKCANCERPVPDSLTLCTTCADNLAMDLREVPALVAELTVTRAGQGKVAALRNGGRSAEIGVPVRANVRGPGIWIQGDRELTRLETAVIGWAQLLAEEGGACVHYGGAGLVQLTADHRRAVRDKTGTLCLAEELDPGNALGAAVSPLEQAAVWLGHQRHALRRHEAALELLDDVGAALDGIRRIVDRPVEQRPLGPCPGELDDGGACRAELRAPVGEDWVRCRQCEGHWPVDAVRAAAYGAAQDRLCTLAEIVRLARAFGTPVSKATLYRWAARGVIGARGWLNRTGGSERITDHQIGPDDVRVYRFGDVCEIAEREARGISA